MPTQSNHWTKRELEIYILLLCAQSDADIAVEELDVIKNKADAATFEKMSEKIAGHTEKQSLKKIRRNLAYHPYSIQEIGDLRREIDAVFLADKQFLMKERIMNDILQNIIY